jgi:hypothetical protein
VSVLLVGTIAVAFFVLRQALASEATGWLIWLAAAIVRRAAAMLPAHRHRYEEEWLAEMATFDARPLSGLVTAMRILLRARATGRALGHSHGQAPAKPAESVVGRPRFENTGSPRERHQALVDSFARYLELNGFSPMSPHRATPGLDLVWKDGRRVHAAEVKNLSRRTEVMHLNDAIGQVLRYEHKVSPEHGPIAKVIVVPSEPTDPSWKELCAKLGIALVWPGCFGDAL